MKIELSRIYPVTSHTDYVGNGSTFVAITGFQENGEQYILKALEKGASTIVVQENYVLDDFILGKIKSCGADIKYVKNTREALSKMAAEAYGNPAKK